MAYTTIDNPELYFQTKIFTGNENTLAVTFDGSENMQPDFVWIKNRVDNYNHSLFDSVRGVTKRMASNSTSAEATVSASLTAFGSNGFTLGNDTTANAPNNSHASWNWKAGTSFTNDASGTGIGNIDSAGSVNTDAGFSIISYTGNANADNTVAHGLGSVPKMIILKNRSATNNWMVYHASTGAQAPLFLNLTNAAGSGDPDRFKVVPTSSVFTPGSAQEGNGNGNSIIAYCFAEKKGYSKFNSYVGNGAASDGPFSYTGFKPAFVLTKPSTRADDWRIFDNKRSSSGANPNNKMLFPHTNGVEGASSTNGVPDGMDFLSNGFKIRQATGGLNTSGATYIYMAFAENPFVSSTGVPATAR